MAVRNHPVIYSVTRRESQNLFMCQRKITNSVDNIGKISAIKLVRRMMISMATVYPNLPNYFYLKKKQNRLEAISREFYYKQKRLEIILVRYECSPDGKIYKEGRG